MVMTTQHFNFRNETKIEDIVIKETIPERRLLSAYIIVKGACKVVPDDFGEEPFTMNFTYEGRPNEPSSKLLEYLIEEGWNTYRKMIYKEPDTLMDFINKH